MGDLTGAVDDDDRIGHAGQGRVQFSQAFLEGHLGLPALVDIAGDPDDLDIPIFAGDIIGGNLDV